MVSRVLNCFCLATTAASISFLLLFNAYTHNLNIHAKKQISNQRYFSNNKDENLCDKVLKIDRDYPRISDTTTDEQVYEKSKENCSYLYKSYNFPFSSIHFSQSEVKYPIAYSILVHVNVHQVLQLLSAIYAPQNIYCIHVDLKAPNKLYGTLQTLQSCFPNIFLSSKRENVVYESFSRLQADLNCMNDLLDLPKDLYPWQHLINLCGQDFPLATNHEIVNQLILLRGRNLIGGYENPNEFILRRTKYVHIYTNKTSEDGKTFLQLTPTQKKKDGPPFNITVRKNLAYNIFSRIFLNWALFDSEKARALLEWSRDTKTPDEHYWLMLDALPEAPGRTGRISHFQLSLYVKWKNENNLCKGYWKHCNCVFGAGDLAEIIKERKLFANKFDVTFDSTPIICLKRWLNNRKRDQNGLVKEPPLKPIPINY